MPLDLSAILSKVRGVLAAIAPITPIKTDDTLVAVIDAILADAAMFGWFQAKVDQHAAGTLSLEVGPPEQVVETLKGRGINWQQVLAVLPTLLELVKLFK